MPPDRAPFDRRRLAWTTTAKSTPLNELVSGQVLRVVATDPGAMRDFQAFSRQTGHALLQSAEAGGEYVFLLRKQ